MTFTLTVQTLEEQNSTAMKKLDGEVMSTDSGDDPDLRGPGLYQEMAVSAAAYVPGDVAERSRHLAAETRKIHFLLPGQSVAVYFTYAGVISHICVTHTYTRAYFYGT